VAGGTRGRGSTILQAKLHRQYALARSERRGEKGVVASIMKATGEIVCVTFRRTNELFQEKKRRSLAGPANSGGEAWEKRALLSTGRGKGNRPVS